MGEAKRRRQSGELSPTDLPPNVTIRQLAQLFGLGTRRIHQLETAGVLTRSAHDAYPLAENLNRFIAHRVEEATRELIPSGSAGERLLAARAAEREAKAASAAIELAAQEGRLIPADEIERTWRSLTGVMRSALLRLPSRLAPRLVAAKNPGDVAEILRAEVHEVLATLSQTKVEAAPAE